MPTDPNRLLTLPHQPALGEGVAVIDFLADSVAVAYFSALEAEAFFQSLKQVGPRRDFHENVLAAINRFMEVTRNPTARKFVDQLIEGSKIPGDVRLVGEILPELNQAHPEGFALLDLVDPVTFVTLKSSYRRAVRIHHPDVGGNLGAMVAINEAYPRFHRILELHLSQTGHEEGAGHPSVSSCMGMVFRLANLELHINLDDWNLDNAYQIFRQLTTGEWDSASWSQNADHLLSWTFRTATLAERLALAGMRDEAEAVLIFARKGYAVSQKRGLTFGHVLRDTEAVIAGTRTISIRIQHPRQAANAQRLGLINVDGTKSVQARTDRKLQERRQREDAFLAYRTQAGLLQDLHTDRCACGQVNPGHLVPEPDYYQTQIKALSPSQQGEYLQAFKPNGSVELIRKYLYVRLQGLLESVIKDPSPTMLNAVAREAQALGNLISEKGEGYAQAVTNFAKLLDSVPEAERKERCHLLSLLQSPRTKSGFLSIDMDPFSPKLRPDYFAIVIRPLEHLRLAVRTGSLPAEDKQKTDQFRLDLASLNSQEMKDFESQAFRAIDQAKLEPERSATILTDHCRRLQLLGTEIYRTEELQLGYWIDRLTIILLRLQRWQEAKDWLATYFALAPQYRLRSSHSEEKGLRKRMARCDRELLRNQ